MLIEADNNCFTHFLFLLEQEGILEDGDDFAGFRLRVSELVKDVVFIVGSASVFNTAFSASTDKVKWPSESYVG